MRSYRIETATARDAAAVHALVFAEPEPHIRRLSMEQVRRLVEDGVLWLVRERHTEAVVGVCFVEVPITQEDAAPAPAEYGGAYVAPEHRRLGLGLVVANVAIAHYFWDNDPDLDPPPPLFAHVHSHNEKPRTIMHDMGFRQTGSVQVPFDEVGFEHMAAGPDGTVSGDRYEYHYPLRVELFRTVAGYLERSAVDGAGGESSAIEIAAGPGMTAEALRQLADEMEQRIC